MSNLPRGAILIETHMIFFLQNLPIIGSMLQVECVFFDLCYLTLVEGWELSPPVHQSTLYVHNLQYSLDILRFALRQISDLCSFSKPGACSQAYVCKFGPQRAMITIGFWTISFRVGLGGKELDPCHVYSLCFSHSPRFHLCSLKYATTKLGLFCKQQSFLLEFEIR